MNAVDDALCRKMWYLGLFRSVRAFEKLIRYLDNKGSDYKIEWAGDFDVKNKVDCVRIIINYKDIHTSIHIIVDIYDDYKTERAIASWEKYLNNLFNKKKPVEKCCENCRYFKLGVSEEPCQSCSLFNGWSGWKPKEDKEMKRISCTTCRYSEASAQEEPCKSCLGADGYCTYWEEPKEEKKMEQRCDNCRYFKLGVMEEPCVKCTLNGDVWSKWEPKEDKKMVEKVLYCTTKENEKMVEDLFEYAKRDVEEVNKIWEEFFGTYKPSNKPAAPKMPGIEDVIFNGPATIVKWSDGTKTVVKAQKGKNGKTEKLDPEKGLAMAICKKVYGNDGRYYDIFKRYCE